MTNQEAFTKMVQHLRRQGERCVSGSGDCRYRNDKGFKCAVGALIPDEVYSEGMERKSAHWLLKQKILAKGLSEEMLTRMQAVHDHNEPEEWETRLTYLAKQFELVVPPMESE